ncbi:MAG: wax ester/triacylglycerol synthase family O-acyltransferase [Deltaproteobacteria bacterium]|nr:wax ester/triacylglycerol synthase family O-acyltransferase [Deltaproteobacteria bacterium]
MERFSGQDASFLYMETPSVHMHTLKIAVIDLPAKIPYADVFDLVRVSMESKLHLVPRLRLRPVEVPGGLHHPMWVKDPNFNIGRHLYRAKIAEPGGHREMDQAIAEIASTQLPRDRPLWETWLLEGLADGGVVLVTKIHHSLADGVASATMLGEVMNVERNHDDLDARNPTWVPEPLPSRRTLIKDAFRDQREQLGAIGPLMRRTVKGSVNVLKNIKNRATSVPYPFVTPRTAFNRTLSPRRSFASTSLPLAEFKAVKRAANVTLNDVVLATVAGALDQFFDARAEHLSRPLIASVPMAVPSPDDAPRTAGNRVANLFTSLCNDISDPLERLQKIHAVTSQSKEIQQQLGMDTLLDWSEAAPAGLYRWILGAFSQSGLSDIMPPAANLIISNVRGPDHPLYVAGARLRAIYSVGPAIEGIGLNITGWSYCGDLSFALIADADAIPDPHLITDALRGALDELQQATGITP